MGFRTAIELLNAADRNLGLRSGELGFIPPWGNLNVDYSSIEKHILRSYVESLKQCETNVNLVQKSLGLPPLPINTLPTGLRGIDKILQG